MKIVYFLETCERPGKGNLHNFNKCRGKTLPRTLDMFGINSIYWMTCYWMAGCYGIKNYQSETFNEA